MIWWIFVFSNVFRVDRLVGKDGENLIIQIVLRDRIIRRLDINPVFDFFRHEKDV